MQKCFSHLELLQIVVVHIHCRIASSGVLGVWVGPCSSEKCNEDQGADVVE